jgi:hypothetical protein
MQNAIFEPLYSLIGDEIKSYFLLEEHFNGSYHFPYNISPLAFLQYNEEKIYQKISQIGWKVPQDTDPNSTNCVINTFAISAHKKNFNFHPYIFELAKLVREGYMNRDIALEKINKSESAEIIALVEKKLGLK